MKKALGFLFLFLILSACSKSEPAIVKVDPPSEVVTKEPELVEEVSDNEEVDEYIEFKLDDEVLRLNLKQIPILNAYLHAARDRQAIIEKMDIHRIIDKEENDIYLLEFSCQDNECSYLLLNQNIQNAGFLVADFATFENFILSPEESKLLLKFNRESNQDYPLSNIVVIDLEKWEILGLKNNTITNNLFDYNWPIFSANWVDEETIAIAVPDTLVSNPEAPGGFYNKVNEVTFTLGKD
jgi:hypothetical protein